MTKKIPKIRSLYDGSRVTVKRDTGPSEIVQQHQKEECDINNIMNRYINDGVLISHSKGKPLFGDFSKVMDYRSSLDALRDAQDAFKKIPAHIRKRFDNDPGKLIQFLQNSENRDKAIELGLIQKDEETIQKVEVINKDPQPNSKNQKNVDSVKE